MEPISLPVHPDAKEFRLRGKSVIDTQITYLTVVSPKVQLVRYHSGLKAKHDGGVKAIQLQLPYQYWVSRYTKRLNGTLSYLSSSLYFSPHNIHKRSGDKPVYRAWIPNLMYTADMLSFGKNICSTVCWGYADVHTDPKTYDNFKLISHKDIMTHQLFLYSQFYAAAFNSNANSMDNIYNSHYSTFVLDMIEGSSKHDVLDPNSEWYQKTAVKHCSQAELLSMI